MAATLISLWALESRLRSLLPFEVECYKCASVTSVIFFSYKEKE